MCGKTMSWAASLTGLRPTTKLVLMMLADYRNFDTGQCNPSQESLALKSGISKSSVSNHLQSLERKGLIKRVAQFAKKTRARLPSQYNFIGQGCPVAKRSNPKKTPLN